MTQRFPDTTQAEQSATARATAASAVGYDDRFPGVLVLLAFTNNA